MEQQRRLIIFLFPIQGQIIQIAVPPITPNGQRAEKRKNVLQTLGFHAHMVCNLPHGGEGGYEPPKDYYVIQIYIHIIHENI